MSGWIMQRPPRTISDTDLACGSAVTAKTILIIADVAAISQLCTRFDYAIVIRVKLDVVQGLRRMALFTGANLQVCSSLGIMTPGTLG